MKRDTMYRAIVIVVLLVVVLLCAASMWRTTLTYAKAQAMGGATEYVVGSSWDDILGQTGGHEPPRVLFTGGVKIGKDDLKIPLAPGQNRPRTNCGR